MRIFKLLLPFAGLTCLLGCGQAAPAVPASADAAAKDSAAVETAAGADVTITPQIASPFGKVDEYMTAHKWDGSTEDIAFAPDGSYAVMGVPDHLLRVSPAGDVTEIFATGDKYAYPLGMQFAPDGTLVFCDSQGKALRQMNKANQVTTLATTDGKNPLEQPNDMILDSKGRVWFTDPCLGELLRFDPADKSVTVLATFDLATQGGPNGIALSPDGQFVAVTTENVTLTCGKGGAGLTTALGRAWRAKRTEGALQFEALGEARGVFGDGCLYDKKGNLYATFDAFDSPPAIKLNHTEVAVFPAGGGAPQVLVKSEAHLFANVVFGKGAFDDTKLYLALLTVPPFTDEHARGLLTVFGGVGLAP